MLYLAITPEVSSVRAYDEPDGYARRIPYLAIVTVTHLTDTTAYLHGAVGKVDREMWAATLNLLRERGVKTVMLERHGRMKTIVL
ncbi:hypothetical protein CR105_26400 [Massilia eurypsychrophila]|uniref:Uncharacterized protein n=2 Tax=Massilia eurypsychrophila TaxID=1485217 RepID=A0A2G8T7R8_9BURK|nr:hypothetical protein [Massilia eurypsychrophila]PIL42029.1 hypothetical protein CR105_26400 [Massilia eurypsychrophila]